MNLIFFDDPDIRGDLLPLTFTRPVADLRVGILTIREKWEKRLATVSSTRTVDYLSEKFPCNISSLTDNIWVNGSICPSDSLVQELKSLVPGASLRKGDTLIGFNSGLHGTDPLALKKDGLAKESRNSFIQIAKPWHLFRLNGEAIREDYDLITKGRKSATISPTNRVSGTEIFIEQGASVEYAILNSQTGPVYIGSGTEIMEGCMIRGPFALCEHAGLKMGAKIYGPTTLGPYCKAGGEISNSILQGYSNKGHDGFLGNSVLGEWCNLGADTNNSNLKNNYAEVQLYNYRLKKPAGTGLQFCGLIMGDHAKTGINTMLNTGTVVGVSANIFGGGFPETFIPDFSWGGAGKREEFRLDKALEVAARMYERRNKVLEDSDKRLLTRVFELTKSFRN
ncbi:MAG: GlmU family protein [Bacteroidia bacterium]